MFTCIIRRLHYISADRFPYILHTGPQTMNFSWMWPSSFNAWTLNWTCLTMLTTCLLLLPWHQRPPDESHLTSSFFARQNTFGFGITGKWANGFSVNWGFSRTTGVSEQWASRRIASLLVKGESKISHSKEVSVIWTGSLLVTSQPLSWISCYPYPGHFCVPVASSLLPCCSTPRSNPSENPAAPQ